MWSLDAAVALGTARAAFGVLRVSSHGYAISSVVVTVAASLLYVAWRRLRLPVAMWTAASLGGLGWLTAVAVGTHHAADQLSGDLGRLAQAWPALTVALVAGLWSIRLTDAVWRRVAAGLSLFPLLIVFEVIGWSHGWVVGAAVMLAGYVVAALASVRVPGHWSPAVGGTALVLGLSSVVGLLPDIVAIGARMGLALIGSWRGPNGLPLDLLSGDVGPWLLPVTALVVLALLPRVTIDSHRVSLGWHHTAGVFVAALGVLPILYGAGFWTSMAVLVVAALVLLWGARAWGHDTLLVLGSALLAIMRVCAYYDDLADPLRVDGDRVDRSCLGADRASRDGQGRVPLCGRAVRPIRRGTVADVCGAPRPFHGLVIVIGSLGLVASQTLREAALTRGVAEGLSVIWAVAGLAMAESSPSHRALELTVLGVAAGITAYLSEDRRKAGWVSGLLLTVASWIRLADNNIQTVEWYTVPAAMALLFYGVRRLRHDPRVDLAFASRARGMGPGPGSVIVPGPLTRPSRTARAVAWPSPQ